MDNVEYRSVVAKNIRNARESQCMTQHELAEEAGLLPSYISQVENARRLPSLFNAARLAAALHISMEQLFEYY